MAVLIGCSSSPGHRSADHPPTKRISTPKPAAGPSPGWSFAVTRELNTAKDAVPGGIDTWGADLVLNTAVKNPLPEGAVVQALTDHGGLLISQSDTSVENGNVVLRPAKVSIW